MAETEVKRKEEEGGEEEEERGDTREVKVRKEGEGEGGGKRWGHLPHREAIQVQLRRCRRLTDHGIGLDLCPREFPQLQHSQHQLLESTGIPENESLTVTINTQNTAPMMPT